MTENKQIKGSLGTKIFVAIIMILLIVGIPAWYFGIWVPSKINEMQSKGCYHTGGTDFTGFPTTWMCPAGVEP